jgi:acetyl esterase
VRTTAAIIAITATLVLGVWVAIEASPWPSALAIRYLFDSDAWRTNAALAGRVPAGVEARRNEYLTPQFPPSFISVDNADPLSQQSHALAAAQGPRRSRG